MALEEKTYQAGYRKISIRTSDGNTFEGKVNIGAQKRMSDIFTASGKPFIILVDTEGPVNSGKTLFINRDHIVWAHPRD